MFEPLICVGNFCVFKVQPVSVIRGLAYPQLKILDRTTPLLFLPHSVLLDRHQFIVNNGMGVAGDLNVADHVLSGVLVLLALVVEQIL